MTDEPSGAVAEPAAEGGEPEGGGEAVAPEAGGVAPASQEAVKSWHDGTSEEGLAWLKNRGFDESPDMLINEIQTLTALKGVPSDRLLKLPEDMQDGEAMGEVYTRLGRPEAPANYTMPEMEEGRTVDENMEAWFRNAAHEVGFSDVQFGAMIGKYNDLTDKAAESVETEAKNDRESLDNALRGEWGSKYDERKELARRAAERFGGDDLATVDEIAKILDSPKAVKMFALIGDQLREDGFVGGAERELGMTDAQIKDKIESLNAELLGNEGRYALYKQQKGVDWTEMQRLQSKREGADRVINQTFV